MTNTGPSAPRRRFAGSEVDAVHEADLAALAEVLFPSRVDDGGPAGSALEAPAVDDPAAAWPPAADSSASVPAADSSAPAMAAAASTSAPASDASTSVEMVPGAGSPAVAPSAPSPPQPAQPQPAQQQQPEEPRPVLPVAASEVLPATVAAPIAKAVSREAPIAAPARAALALPAGPRAAARRGHEAPSVGALYAIVPAGIDPADRRRVSLEAAARLARPDRPAAVLVFDAGHVDAVVVGGAEPLAACNITHLDDSDYEWRVREIIERWGPVGLVALDESAEDLRRIGCAAGRPIFLAAADEEGIVEAYRGLKLWRRVGAGTEAALFLPDAPTPQLAAHLHRRLARAAQEFLGCDLALQQESAGAAEAGRFYRVRCVFAGAAAAEIWPLVLSAAGIAGEPPGAGDAPATADEARATAQEAPATADEAPMTEDSGAAGDAGSEAAADATRESQPEGTGPGQSDDRSEAGAQGQPAPAPAAQPVPPLAEDKEAPEPTEAQAAPDVTQAQAEPEAGDGGAAQAADGGVVLAPWTPADRGEILAILLAQAPALVPGPVRCVFRVDVDEPAAPPLAAVRQDGALVAILLAVTGEQADTAAAEAWLAVHRSLLARAYPAAGISAAVGPTSVVLELFAPPPAAPGVRRLLLVMVGGRPAIVVMP